MITTVCLNPSFDKTVEVESLVPGEVNRITGIRLDPGGKGINVAIVAKRLGLNVSCVGLMGNNGADVLSRMLEKEKIRCEFLRVPGSVRTNTKIVSKKGKEVTELNEPGTPVNEDQLTAFLTMMKKMTVDSDIVVLTGSVPPGCPQGTYSWLMESLPGLKYVLDAEGEELTEGVRKGCPFLIKPNLHELETSLGTRLESLTSIRDAAGKLIGMGAHHVVVSMGHDGALYVNKNNAFFSPALPVQVKSTVGAGDAMVGGILYGYEKTGNMVQAFRYGVAAGNASVMTEGTQLIVPADFECLLSQVTLQEV